MATLFDTYKAQFRKPGNTVTQLLLLNVTVFVGLILIRLILGTKFFQVYLEPHFVLSNHISDILFKPWTLITNFFTHFGFGHILGNMLGLYWFGMIVTDLMGHKRLLSIYILGGLFGSLLYVLIYNINPDYININASLIGASGSVLAIAAAAATIAPYYEVNLFFVIRIKIIYIVGFYALLSLANSVEGSNTGGNIAHLGGLAIGYLFAVQLRKGNDLGKPIHAVMSFFENLFKPKPRMRVSSKEPRRKKTKATSSTTTATETHAASNTNSTTISQAEIDLILDKISQSGYESLTKEEKEKLFSASKKK